MIKQNYDATWDDNNNILRYHYKNKLQPND